ASLFAAVLMGLVVPGVAHVQADGPRVVVAKSASPAAAFCARPINGNVFQSLGEKEDLFSSDLLVCLPGPALASQNGAVTLKSLPDPDGRSPLPILETGLSLNETKDADLDFTLDRGRVDLSNAKTEGSATVIVRFWDKTWKIVLDSPDTQVTVELSGRWP